MLLAELYNILPEIEDEIVNIIHENNGTGPFDGGCIIFAQAINKIIDGEIVVLIREDNTADHAAVLKYGILCDFSGYSEPKEFIQVFNKNELAHTSLKCVSYRNIEQDDLPDTDRDINTSEKIASIILGAYNLKTNATLKY